ncbi:hypothetical protein [Streptomyces sp. NPDC088707]|uniref:hypothetical protein n=1 Tax=Streptomyces sp. NPDC088707 TaxID=3365871 RepID=UPI0038025B24
MLLEPLDLGEGLGTGAHDGEGADEVGEALALGHRFSLPGWRVGGGRHDVPVSGLLQYFEKNPEIFAALVALLVGVSALGGAKLQANAGRAQAAAAREAATITAEAQRVAALWTVRQVQIAQLVRVSSELRQACNRLWLAHDEGQANQVGAKSAELAMLWAEARLIATENVVAAAGVLAMESLAFEETTMKYAQVLQAKKKLARYVPEGTAQATEVAQVMAAMRGEDPEVYAQALHDALRGVLAPAEIYHLVAYGHVAVEEIEVLRSRVVQRCLVAENELVDETRAMLRSRDDVAPAGPVRRRLLRRNSSTGSA